MIHIKCWVYSLYHSLPVYVCDVNGNEKQRGKLAEKIISGIKISKPECNKVIYFFFENVQLLLFMKKSDLSYFVLILPPRFQ